MKGEFFMKEYLRYTLRISPDLIKKIRITADYNSRSTNREIETAVKRYIADFERLHGDIDINKKVER